jgi:hypothetical protein
LTDRDSVWTDVSFEQAVRETAYFLWEQDGRPEGHEQEYWFKALEVHLRQRRSDAELAAGGDTTVVP